jgi:hypothetical protein
MENVRSLVVTASANRVIRNKIAAAGQHRTPAFLFTRRSGSRRYGHDQSDDVVLALSGETYINAILPR